MKLEWAVNQNKWVYGTWFWRWGVHQKIGMVDVFAGPFVERNYNGYLVAHDVGFQYLPKNWTFM
jgi:hypothetical protein